MFKAYECNHFHEHGTGGDRNERGQEGAGIRDVKRGGDRIERVSGIGKGLRILGASWGWGNQSKTFRSLIHPDHDFKKLKICLFSLNFFRNFETFPFVAVVCIFNEKISIFSLFNLKILMRTLWSLGIPHSCRPFLKFFTFGNFDRGFLVCFCFQLEYKFLFPAFVKNFQFFFSKHL